MATIKTGIVALTVVFKHICRLLSRYGPAIQSQISAAVVSALITEAQAAVLRAFITTATDVCDILRAISGY